MIDFTSVGILLVFLGFAIVVISFLASKKEVGREVRGAGVVMVGPIPIVFGSDARWASLALVLAVFLLVLMVLFYLV